MLWIGLVLGAVTAAGPGPTFTIYTEIHPPQQIQAADGSLSGLGVEVVRAIQGRLGDRQPIQVVPWPRAYRAALADPGVVLFTMARTPEREHLFQWVGPLDETVYALWVRADSGLALHGLAEAKGLRRIGVYRDDVRDQLLTGEGFSNLDRVTDNATNLRKLLSGRLDAIAASPGEVDQWTRAGLLRPGQLRLALAFYRAQLYIAFSRGTRAATVRAWAAGLEALRRSGALARIQRKYQANQAAPAPAGPGR